MYCILATSEEGEEVYVDIYCAGSGPAVGGMQDEKSGKAAKALVDYVWKAEPVNYWYYVKKKYKLNVDFLSNQWNPIPPFSAIMSSKSSNSVTISSRNS